MDEKPVCQEAAEIKVSRNITDIHRAKTCCPKGHPYAGENLRLTKYGRCCRECVRQSEARRRRANPDRQKANQANSNSISKHTAFLVDEAINAGWTIGDITGEAVNPKGPRIVGETSLLRFRRKNPKIDKRWAKLLLKNKSLQIRRVFAAPALLKNGGADANQAVMHATRNVWEPIRSFVMTDMIIAIGDGTLRIRDAEARVKEFERAYNRQNKHSVESKHGNWSLDKPMFEDGSGTWADAYSDDQAMWGENSKAIYAR